MTGFAPGDVVRLTCGGPKMTVTSVASTPHLNDCPSPYAYMSWWDGSVMRSISLPVAALKKVKP